jgi:hypothetical protein
MASVIDPPLVERMVKLIRALVRYDDSDSARFAEYEYDPGPIIREARAIASELPKPVDPDLIEAEQIVAEYMGVDLGTVQRHRPGVMAVQIALPALKRGRQLEREANRGE